MKKSVLVTGGAGYVGAILVPFLIENGYSVDVLDLFMYKEDLFNEKDINNGLITIHKGDIRDQKLFRKAVRGKDIVIHLACISNDPSFDLNPDLGKSINLDCFEPMVKISREEGVSRFIYASSSSVYGVKEESNVHEDMKLEPLTDYSKFKAECEVILSKYASEDFTVTTVRPATVCGYSPRQRLDVIVNILTNHAYFNRKIKVFGGDQKRPNIHIKDMVRVYLALMEAPKEKVNGEIFNAGIDNHTLSKQAQITQRIVGNDVEIEKVETNDNRSYHISSEKIKNILGFQFQYSIEDAVKDLVEAFKEEKLKDTFKNKSYYNIQTMLGIGLV